MAEVLIKAGVNIKVNVKGDKLTKTPAFSENYGYGVGGINLNDDTGNRSTLCKAIYLNNFNLVNLLFDKGYDVHAGKEYRAGNGNPLCIATYTKNYHLVELLLFHGADVNAFFSDPKEANAMTPLRIAISARNDHNMDIIRLLIVYGASMFSSSIPQIAGNKIDA